MVYLESIMQKLEEINTLTKKICVNHCGYQITLNDMTNLRIYKKLDVSGTTLQLIHIYVNITQLNNFLDKELKLLRLKNNTFIELNKMISKEINDTLFFELTSTILNESIKSLVILRTKKLYKKLLVKMYSEQLHTYKQLSYKLSNDNNICSFIDDKINELIDIINYLDDDKENLNSGGQK